MSTARPRGRVLLVLWMSTVLTLILATLAIERFCPEAPYGFRAAIWGLLLVTPVVYTLTSRYGRDRSESDR